ncbi:MULTISPECIES: hypothetical protein [Haloarcula]|uniref:hypothetical protein n=1 Tax=Haloarcula TaxID=2237 RepID=UPI0023EDDD7C|nr:hypothetical protein [Halomicroarcula sp. XH51]
MQLTKLTGALLAVFLVTGSAAALPAAAGAQASDNAAANENATTAQADANVDETAVDAAEADDTEEADADRRGPPADVGAAGQRGPPTSMPAPVPDFVSDVHETINDHVAGTLEGDLGRHISDLTPGDGSDDEDATAQDAASETADASNATEQ